MASRSSRHKAQKRRKKSAAPLIGVAALLVVLVVVGAVWLLGNGGDKADAGVTNEPEVFTFPQGISVGDMDISDLTYEEAEDKLSSVAGDMMSNSIELTVEGKDEPYTVTLDSLGVDVGTKDVLDSAKEYVEDAQKAFETEEPEKKKKSDEDEEGTLVAARDFPLEFTYDISDIQDRLDELSESEGWGKKPSTGSYKVDTSNDEGSLTTSGKLIKAEPEDGYGIVTSELAELIEEQLVSGEFDTIEAPTEELEAESASDKEVHLISSATTSFKDSDKNRRYNIWKISSKLNGVVFKPGVTFSVNDHVGDRTAENGWKEGQGIEDGMLTPQYGGGICQVSTTMYNATLKAEMKMVNRLPHTMHVKYVPEGLDATISTGGPDFKVMNRLDSEMYMVVKCDNSSSTVTVEVYGYEKRDYDIKLSTEKVSTTEEEKMEPVQYTVNSELSKYAIRQLKSGQKYSKWQIKGQKIAKGSGKVIEEMELGTSTYQALAPVYEIGTGVPKPEAGTPVEKVKASVPGGGVVTTPTLAPDNTPSATPAPSGDDTSADPAPTSQPNGNGGGGQTQSPATAPPATQAPATPPPATQPPATPPPVVATEPPPAPPVENDPPPAPPAAEGGGDVIVVE